MLPWITFHERCSGKRLGFLSTAVTLRSRHSAQHPNCWWVSSLASVSPRGKLNTPPLLLLEASSQFGHKIFKIFSTWGQKDSGTVAMATHMSCRQLIYYQAVITLSFVRHVIKTREILPDHDKFVFRNCLTHEYVYRCHFVIAIIATRDRNTWYHWLDYFRSWADSSCYPQTRESSLCDVDNNYKNPLDNLPPPPLARPAAELDRPHTSRSATGTRHETDARSGYSCATDLTGITLKNRLSDQTIFLAKLRGRATVS